jgi:hypothetical protein
MKELVRFRRIGSRRQILTLIAVSGTNDKAIRLGVTSFFAPHNFRSKIFTVFSLRDKNSRSRLYCEAGVKTNAIFTAVEQVAVEHIIRPDAGEFNQTVNRKPLADSFFFDLDCHFFFPLI